MSPASTDVCVRSGRVSVPEPTWSRVTPYALDADEVREDVVVVDADVLVGVPVYRGGSMVARCLRSLRDPGVQLLIVDNGSDEDVRRVLPGHGVILRNRQNRYVNPAWNQVLRHFLGGRWDLLVLANSDLVLSPGWSRALRAARDLDRRAGRDRVLFGLDGPRARSSMGSFFALPRRAAAASYPIPDDLLVLGGDDFVLHVCHGVGIGEATVESVTMTHVERGTYDQSPEVWGTARSDTDRWNQYVLPDLVPRRIREVLLRGV